MLFRSKCSVDGGPVTTCTSPLSLTGLAEGAHEVVVYQLSAASPPVQSAATTVRWSVDLTPPHAPAIAGVPNGPTNQTGAAFSIDTEPNTTLECRLLPGGVWGACPDPLAYSGLADGAYTFQTRAIDQVGNVSAVSSHAWTVDTVPPTGTPAITSGPDAITPSSVAVFSFTYGSDGAGAVCSLDGGAYAPCATPYTVPDVAEGSHTLRVKAVDAAGNVGANIATAAWDVFVPTTPPPGPVGIKVAGGAAWTQTLATTADIVWPADTRWEIGRAHV